MSNAFAEQSKQEPAAEPGIVTGSLYLGVCLSVITSAVLVRSGHVGWCWGFSIGAGISLLSLFSLGILVPRLTIPTASGASQFLLALVLFLKLPLYTAALYMVTRMPGVDARSAFPGILVAPMAITARAVGSLIWQSLAEAAYRRQIKRGGFVVRGSRRARVSVWRRRPAEPVSEQG